MKINYLMYLLLPVSLAVGQGWVPQNSGTTDWLTCVTFLDNNHGWMAGGVYPSSGSILRTANGGSTWTIQSGELSDFLSGIEFVDNNTGWAVGCGGLILQTTNGGNSWTSQSSGTSAHLGSVTFTDLNTGWVVGFGGTILHTTNGGTTWTSQNSGTVEWVFDVVFLNSDTGWAVGGGNPANSVLLHTTNGGGSWISQNSGTAQDLRGVSFANAYDGWAVGTGGTIIHTTDGGATWVSQNSGTGAQLNDVIFLNANIGWVVGLSGTILHTTNCGTTWIPENGGTPEGLDGVFFVDYNNGWATGHVGTILHYYSPPQFRILSPNGGEQWHIFQYDTVRWAFGGNEGPIRIELNRAYPDGTWETVSDSTDNDGAEAIYVTDPLSDRCRVRLSTVGNTLSDISDSDFSIISSQGYLALVETNAPNTPIVAWDIVLECPMTGTASFRLKNFGNDAIVVFQPLEPITQEFSRTTSCGSLFALGVSQMSACSLTVTFDPSADSVYHDSLLIQTDAINAMNGYVRIPLTGERISTPDTPQVLISIEDYDARLNWLPITESIYGCPVTVTAYLVFYSPTAGGPYYFHGYTTDTTYVHYGAVRFTTGMFYDVIAITDPLSRLDSLVAGIAYTREEIIAIITN